MSYPRRLKRTPSFFSLFHSFEKLLGSLRGFGCFVEVDQLVFREFIFGLN
jgi:hypothetical protein